MLRYPSLALDSSGNPVVSWNEGPGPIVYDDYGDGGDIYVKRWNGSSWVQVGNTFLDVVAENQSSYTPSLALDSSDNPVVSWSQCVSLGESTSQVFCTNESVFVKRWNGSEWIQLGNALNDFKFAVNPSLAIDNSDNPVVAWNTVTFGGSGDNIYVKRWNGSSWVQQGPFLNALNKRTFSPSLALDSLGNPVVSWDELGNVYVSGLIRNVWQDLGSSLDVVRTQSAINSQIARTSSDNPVVAWVELDSINSKNIYVKQWTGTSWSQLGSALDTVITNDVRAPSLAMLGNYPIVAWQENNNIYVKIWSGTAWDNIGPALDRVIANDAITPSLARDSSNYRPVVAYVENKNIYIRKASGYYSNSFWGSPYGNQPLDITVANTAYHPSLTLTSDNRPIVAWYEDDGTSTNIYVKEWTGTAWTALGGAIDKSISRDATDVKLALRSDNRPVVAWEEAGDIYVKRWNGTSWVSIGGSLDMVPSNQAWRPSIELKSNNTPVVVWEEQNGTSSDIYVKTWNGSSWVHISTTAVDKVLNKKAQRPSLVLKSDNNPIISWDEQDGTSESVYVRQY